MRLPYLLRSSLKTSRGSFKNYRSPKRSLELTHDSHKSSLKVYQVLQCSKVVHCPIYFDKRSKKETYIVIKKKNQGNMPLRLGQLWKGLSGLEIGMLASHYRVMTSKNLKFTFFVNRDWLLCNCASVCYTRGNINERGRGGGLNQAWTNKKKATSSSSLPKLTSSKTWRQKEADALGSTYSVFAKDSLCTI